MALSMASTQPPLWSLSAAMAHKTCVLAAASKAELAGKKAWVGLHYDRAARTSWSRRAATNEVCVSHCVRGADMCTIGAGRMDLTWPRSAASSAMKFMERPARNMIGMCTFAFSCAAIVVTLRSQRVQLEFKNKQEDANKKKAEEARRKSSPFVILRVSSLRATLHTSGNQSYGNGNGGHGGKGGGKGKHKGDKRPWQAAGAEGPNKG